MPPALSPAGAASRPHDFWFIPLCFPGSLWLEFGMFGCARRRDCPMRTRPSGHCRAHGDGLGRAPRRRGGGGRGGGCGRGRSTAWTDAGREGNDREVRTGVSREQSAYPSFTADSPHEQSLTYFRLRSGFPLRCVQRRSQAFAFRGAAAASQLPAAAQRARGDAARPGCCRRQAWNRQRGRAWGRAD